MKQLKYFAALENILKYSDKEVIEVSCGDSGEKKDMHCQLPLFVWPLVTLESETAQGCSRPDTLSKNFNSRGQVYWKNGTA